MPISNISLFNSLALALNNNANQLQATEQEISTGKSVNQPSANPAAYAESELLTDQQSALTNDVSLATQAQDQLNTISSALTSTANALDSAIQSATQGADATISSSQMQDLGQTVSGLLSQVISLANTQYSGSYVFGGDQVLTQPYSATGTYSGDANGNSVQLSDGTSLQLTFDGQSIFGDSTTGVIGTLTSLVSALNAGNKSAVAATLPQLQSALQEIATASDNVGTSASAAANTITNGNNNLTTLASDINDVSGTNVAQAATQFQAEDTQQQALVALGSELSQMPLINILA
jgi:flagellar hook-associated protein 3 FlgL